MNATDKAVKEYIEKYVARGWVEKQSTLDRYLREARRKFPEWLDNVLKEVKTDEVIGIIGDTHCLFDHPNYADFCYDTFKKNHVTKVIHIGDLVDNHAISRHQTETCAMSPLEEYAETLEHVKKYTERFPELTLIRGNHDDIPLRQMASLGIPPIFLRDMHELWKLPKKWDIVEDIILNDVYYFHGVGSSGKYCGFNRAMANRMSTVQGHIHSAFHCIYHANPTGLIFGMAVGAGVDNEAYAFAYGKPSPNKSVLGCGIVFSSVHAMAVPMDKKYFRR